SIGGQTKFSSDHHPVLQQEIGRDASTLDAVKGVQGEKGKFGLQAGDIEVAGVRSHAWSATGGNFRLKGMKVDVSLGGKKCF
ncbi:DUF6230 family protein, partial [Streptomyces hundungensis]|uniref:DUF6230 family protein n=1 Tax=Streptomyces hundungensis TaxID=1077946 RepID=UPI0033F3615D